MSRTHVPFSELELQALVDGELTAAEIAAVTAWVESSPAAAEKLALLRAVHATMADFAKAAEVEAVAGPPPDAAAEPDVGTAAPHGNGLWNWRTLLAAAALVVVGVIFFVRPRPDGVAPAQGRDSAENGLFRLQVAPLHGGSWPVYSAIAIELRWLDKGDKPLCVLGTDGDAAAAAAMARGEVPLRLEVVLRGPGGRELRGSVRAPAFVVPVAAPASKAAVQTIELWQVAVRDQALAPIFGIGVDGTQWRLDPNWCLLHFARELAPGERWCVPEEAGDYELEVHVVRATVDGPADADSALVATMGFRVEATASAWSEPSDGLRARLVAARPQLAAGQPTALALQLRNESGRMRQYNVVGSTLAPIPQPYHFELLVDGVAWQQQQDRSICFSSDWMFAEHPDRTLRSIVVLPEQWQHDGRHLGDLPGEHALQFRFHFVPTLWSGGDTLWQGEVTTPPLRVSVGKAK